MTSLVTRNLEKYNRYFIVKNGSTVFGEGTVVEREITIHNCNLVYDPNDTLHKEWIMDYDLYPVNPRNVRWSYFDEEYHKIAENFMSEN